MAKVGAQRAAELTGKSKSTIQRSMNSGKLSYEMDANNRRIIDVSELERVFGLQSHNTESGASEAVEAELKKASNMLEMERMKMQIKALEDQLEAGKEQIEDLKMQRDQWQKQAQQVLLTSEYSQRQAEEYKAELQAREEKAKVRRQQMLEERMKGMKGQNENQNTARNSANSSTGGQNSSFQGFWQKIKGSSKAA